MNNQTVPDWLVKADRPKEFYTDERCFITELFNSDTSPDVSLAMARVEPGVTTQLHSLRRVTEVTIILQGSGLMRVGNEEQAVCAGDQITIGPGVAQCVFNDGDVDLVFYCVCKPRFIVECYVDLEQQ